MKIIETLRSSLRALVKNKRRSILTMLGFIIGLSSVITIMSLGRGFEKAVISNLTANQTSEVVMNILFEPKDANLQASSTPFYDASDIDLALSVTGVEKVKIGELDRGFTPLQAVSQGDGRNRPVELLTSNDPPQVAMSAGRSLDQGDEEAIARVVILSSEAAENLFGPGETGLGRNLDIGGLLHRVVGIYKGASLRGTQINNMNYDMYMPQSTYRRYYAPENTGNNLMLTIARGATPKDVANAVLEKLELRGSMKDEGGYRIFDLALLLEGIGNILSLITIFISAIAGISLLISGVGVMNMMYISVSERTREIGIRRALGATKNNIRNQFLLEGLAITLIGGFLGLALGYLIALVLGRLLPFEPVVDITAVLITTIISGSIGLFFSFMPANSAARKDLIDIIR